MIIDQSNECCGEFPEFTRRRPPDDKVEQVGLVALRVFLPVAVIEMEAPGERSRTPVALGIMLPFQSID